ncbi:MAG: hypothetical protein FJW37_04835, partial [Acidobacteria bacterium]|nr:hypothetical protein [Acidobacteriota bacterium]
MTAFPALLAAVFPGGSALAQTDKPPEAAGFETQGETTAGYRFSDVGGRREKFQELFNLRGGPRLLDFHLGGSDSTGKNRFADNYQLTASGLGGDPFPGGQFVISKARLYDFRASFRQTYYYWDRNDSAVLPSGFRGLTTNHNWATVRRFGSANLLAHASNRLKFRFEYGRSSRNGVNYTTRVMDYFGSPAAWGAFLRDSPYYVEAPLQESTDRVSGGFNYTAGSWSFQYTAGYQQFEQDLGWRNVASPQVSINLDSAASRREPLVAARWSEFRSLKTPLSEFFYNGRVNSRLSLRGDFIFFRYRGPATLDAAFTGVARTTGTAVGSYDISL